MTLLAAFDRSQSRRHHLRDHLEQEQRPGQLLAAVLRVAAEQESQELAAVDQRDGAGGLTGRDLLRILHVDRNQPQVVGTAAEVDGVARSAELARERLVPADPLDRRWVEGAP